MWKKNVIRIAVGMSLGAGVSLASGAPINFSIDTGFDFDNDGSTKTGVYTDLSFSNSRATSIYDLSTGPIGSGTTVIDTNIDSELDSRGFQSVIGQDPGGDVIRRPGLIGDRNVTQLSPADDAAITNGFATGTGGFSSWGLPSPFGGEGTSWGLTYNWFLEGTVDANGQGVFSDGFFDIYYHDSIPTASDPDDADYADRNFQGTQVLRLNVDGSQILAGDEVGLRIFGDIDYSWLDDEDAPDNFVKNFFWDEDSNISFYDLWASGQESDQVMVNWLISTQVFAGTDFDVATVSDDDKNLLWGIRQTSLDGNNRFEKVPEPSSLALFGISLLIMGGIMAKRGSRKGSAEGMKA
ncbi:PEP-CTERM sorting domain-containing protein [Ectothiorhodospira marina]|uniref:PEP-CTERM protein-sorting domain-containing protein n=1 Tax=Ectothiorhodospira marina TaxID=1396821 RepID=A0A1H7ILE9_9GAMM|nr:PEP-CTERM sorting domain-containing protein [Ectothiorhodospira marina]SEK63286.1 PEP-CTERM protein-sorting domain-containing protein [Ectothiorhodospira marina]